MKKILIKLCSRFEEYLCMVMMIIMCCATTIQIIGRLTKHPPVWSMELAIYCFIWIAFVGMAWAEKNHSHFSVDVFTRWVKGKPKLALDMINDILASLFYALLVYWAIRYYPLLAKQLSTAMRISKAVPEVGMIVGFALCLVHRVSHLVRTCRAFADGTGIEEAKK